MPHSVLDEHLQEKNNPANINPLLKSINIVIFSMLFNLVLTCVLLPFLALKFGYVVSIITLILCLVVFNKLLLVFTFGKNFKASFFINGSIYIILFLFRFIFSCMVIAFVVIELENTSVLSCILLTFCAFLSIAVFVVIELMALFTRRLDLIEASNKEIVKE